MAITKTNLLGAINRYLRAYSSVGLNLEIRFQEGSRTQGVAYSIEMRDGSAAPGTGNGIIGLTRQEAWDTLLHIARAIEDMQSRLGQTQSMQNEPSYFKCKDGNVIGYQF